MQKYCKLQQLKGIVVLICMTSTRNKFDFLLLLPLKKSALLKVVYYGFYEARAHTTIRLPDVNIAHMCKTLAGSTKRNKKQV